MNIGQIRESQVTSPLSRDDTSTSATSGPASALPEPIDALALSGDPGAELAALAVKSGDAQREAARTARDAYEATQVREQAAEVGAMREKANDIRTGGIIEGAGMVAQGGADIGCAVSKSPALGQGLKGGAEAARGSTQIVGAFYGADAANHEADATQHKSAAGRAKDAADDMHDATKVARDYVTAALDFYREYASTQAQSRSAALHRA